MRLDVSDALNASMIGDDVFDHLRIMTNLRESAAIICFLSILILFTIAGNLLTLFVVFRLNLFKNSISNLYIASLAGADLFVGCLVMPGMMLYMVVFDGVWPFGRVLCDIWQCVDFIACTTSLYSVCAIGFDRWMNLEKPLRIFKRNKNIARRAIAAVWLIPIMVWVPVFVALRMTQPAAPRGSCGLIWRPRFLVPVVAIPFLYIPVCVLIALFIRISIVIRDHLSFLQKHSNQDMRSNSKLNVGAVSRNSPTHLGQRITGTGDRTGCANGIETMPKIASRVALAKDHSVEVACHQERLTPTYTRGPKSHRNGSLPSCVVNNIASQLLSPSPSRKLCDPEAFYDQISKFEHHRSFTPSSPSIAGSSIYSARLSSRSSQSNRLHAKSSISTTGSASIGRRATSERDPLLAARRNIDTFRQQQRRDSVPVVEPVVFQFECDSEKDDVDDVDGDVIDSNRNLCDALQIRTDLLHIERKVSGGSECSDGSVFYETAESTTPIKVAQEHEGPNDEIEEFEPKEIEHDAQSTFDQSHIRSEFVLDREKPVTGPRLNYKRASVTSDTVVDFTRRIFKQKPPMTRANTSTVIEVSHAANDYGAMTNIMTSTTARHNSGYRISLSSITGTFFAGRRISLNLFSEIMPCNGISQQIRAARAVGVMLLCFLLCWLPFLIIWPLRTYCPECVSDQSYQFAIWANYFNSTCNPIVYVLWSPRFQALFKRVLAKRRKKKAAVV